MADAVPITILSEGVCRVCARMIILDFEIRDPVTSEPMWVHQDTKQPECKNWEGSAAKAEPVLRLVCANCGKKAYKSRDPDRHEDHMYFHVHSCGARCDGGLFVVEPKVASDKLDKEVEFRGFDFSKKLPEPDPQFTTHEDDLIGTLGMLSEILADIDRHYATETVLTEKEWVAIWASHGESS